jgi:hypothetical protein
MQCLKPTRIRDKAYTRSAQRRHCMVRHPDTGDFCNGESVVCCHIRITGNAGTSLKPGDDESLFLCGKHHDEFDRRRGTIDETMSAMAWLIRNVYIPDRKQAFRAWKMGVGK